MVEEQAIASAETVTTLDGRLLYARAIALGLDLICIGLLASLFGFGIGLLAGGQDRVPTWLQLSFFGLLWVLVEAAWQSSPGKAMLGLRYVVAGGFWQRYARLLLRLGLRSLLIFLSGLMMAPLGSLGPPRDPVAIAFRLILMMIAFLLPHPGLYLRLSPPLSPNTATHDWLSKTRVSYGAAPPSWPRLFAGTLAAVFPLWLIIMVNASF